MSDDSVDESVDDCNYDCVFELSKMYEPYNTGDRITGKVILTSKTNKQIKVIKLRFIAMAKVRWRAKEFKRRRFTRQTITVFGEELTGYNSYANKYNDVLVEGELLPGSHDYKIDFIVPANGLSSMEHKFGQMRYELSLEIVEHNFKTKIFKKPLSVIKLVNLNVHPIYKEPASITVETTAWYNLLLRRKVKYTLETQATGFAPGELLQYTFKVANRTFERILGFTVAFIKHVTYSVANPVRTQTHSETSLASRYLDLNDLTNDSFSGNFNIPSTPPTTETINMMYVEYTLRVTTSLQNSCSKLAIEVPIFVGTVPLNQSRKPVYKSTIHADSPFTGSATTLQAKSPTNYFKPIYPTFMLRDPKRRVHFPEKIAQFCRKTQLGKTSPQKKK